MELHLSEAKSEHPTATHHCYAWRVNPAQPEEYASDAGEPGGTAGLPILNQLRSAELINVGCIVVRYYGGTKLGKAGLIESYGHTAGLCIEQARLHRLTPTRLFRIEYPYELQSQVERWKNTYNLTEKESEYGVKVRLTLACPLPLSDAFAGELDSSRHLLESIETLGNSWETE